MALVAPATVGAAGPGGGASAGRTAPAAPAVSRLVQMQARFQKKQMEEKEQKLLRLYESQQQRAFERVGRGGGSAGSSTASLSSSTSTLASLGGGGGGGGGSGGGGGGKVRQLFQERRSNGWDRSYPLEPVAAGGGGGGGGNKAATAPVRGHPHSQSQPQPVHLPIAVPKTKLTRGASLDRSHAAFQQHKNNTNNNNAVRRSKSHARAAAEPAANHQLNGGSFYDHSAYRKAGREFNNNTQNNFRRHPRDPEDDPDRDEDDDEDFVEDDVDYSANQRFIAAPPDNKRQEELFAKYQVRELSRTHSPPPYDEGIDEGTFIYEKESNGLNDRFKTYVSGKHRPPQPPFQEEIIPRAAMASKGLDAKKGPAAARRESVSPPTRAPPKPLAAHKKSTEQTNAAGSATAGSSAPPNQRSTFSSSATKKAPSVSRPTSSPLSKSAPSSSGAKATQRAKNGPSAPAPVRSAPTRDDLTECPICHRRFTNDRIKVHQEICSKTSQKKRKEYDATKHRVQGTEAEQFVRKPMRPGLVQKKAEPKKADWRKKHEEFIQTIRAAKEAQAHVAAGGKLSDLPPPPPMDTSDYVQCPHCGRKFNEAAADRHIPRCANMQHNKPKPVGKPSGGGMIKRR